MKRCKFCHTDNRDSAKFCRECGNLLTPDNPFVGLISKDNIIPSLQDYVQRCKARKSISSLAGKQQSQMFGLDCFITGDTGSGKHYLADLLRDIAFNEGVITKYEIASYDASEIDSLLKNMDSVLASNANGIIHITDAHKLLPSSAMTQVSVIDKLFLRMRQNQNMPIVFISGLPNVMKPFAQHNPDIAKLFEYHFYLEPFDDNSMRDLACLKLTELKIAVSDAANEKMLHRFKYLCRNRDESFANGNDVVGEIQKFIVNMNMRGGSLIEEQDVQGQVFVPKTEKELFEQLDDFVGLENVKKEIHAIVDTLKSERRLKGDNATIRIKDHFIFTGNPGTGKTTIARVFADLLNTLEVLPSGQLVEVTRKDLVSEFLGGTAQKVDQVVSKAIGGVLFIDEAYSLKSDEHDSFGQEAIDTLLPILENRRGEFVCIIAGYTKEMGEFIRTNSGLESRFNKRIDFPDYQPKELLQIFNGMIQNKGLSLSEDAKDKMRKFFDKMYLSRDQGKFGNARDVRNVVEKAIERLNSRRRAMNDDQLSSEGNLLNWEDIVGPENAKEITVDDVLSEMDRFIGMDNVKKAVRDLAEEMAMDQRRMEAGVGKASLKPVNIILTGNPGTGKTSIARIFGKLFHAMGITATDRVIEKSRKDIVSGFVNQSDKMMDKAINEAMGGVLFIDEAYSFAPFDDLGQCTDTEGLKALERLMTRMENDRGKFVVICAGYKDKMQNLYKANDGFKSRFTHEINIEDYSAAELCKIFELFVTDAGYKLQDQDCRDKLLKMFDSMLLSRTDNFGNAREARTAFEKSVRNQSVRLKRIPADLTTREDLMTIKAEDIPFKEPEKVDAQDCLRELDSLIGLSNVKEAMRRLVDTINRERTIAERFGRKPNIPVGHYMFLGNPGTGKTTVARMMGKILYSMGVLPRPDVIEVDKSQLVAGYVGQTESLTREVIRKSMGAVLFIDEAYELADGHFGKDSLDILLKQLEDRRGDFVCIVAGYTKEMTNFINSNSGLQSRFPSRNCFIFEDYNPSELSEIFEMFCNKDSLKVEDDAWLEIKNKIRFMYDNRNDRFGNARDVRNFFDEIKMHMSERTSGMLNPSYEDLLTVKKEDVKW